MQHFNIKEHVVPACHIREYAGSTSHSQEDLLQLHVKQYTPKSPSNDPHAITLIATHGVGLPKELYEPLWDDLFERTTSKGFSIRGIWIADGASLGYSGVINETKVSNDCKSHLAPSDLTKYSQVARSSSCVVSWMDHARHLLLLINHFRAEMPRPLVGVGHSFGGCQIVNLAYLHPRLFTTLLLLDPVIQLSPPAMGFGTDAPGAINFTVHRKDVWPNRAAAAATQAKMCRDWDPRALDLMMQHGFRNLPTALHPQLPADADPNNPPVTLMTTKHQDVLGQIRENFDARQPDGHTVVNRQTHADLDPLAAFVPLYRPEPRSTFYWLPSLRPSALWVLGSRTFLNLDEMRNGFQSAGAGVGGSGGLAQGRLREVLIKGHGHLFPFSAVGQTADACADWLEREMHIFKEQETEWSKKRAAMSDKDHLVLPPKWAEVVKPMSAFKGKM